MSEKLNFRISSALKDIIGRDLITDDYVAVFELVKNAYDAHATTVDVHFKNINTYQATIEITDNGKGMDYDDILNKWLFVAYSAKREGTEDEDYRNKIYQNKPFAGSKGIGRFSCDKLGKKLEIKTVSINDTKTTQILKIDWEDFEINIREKFDNIQVDYEKIIGTSDSSSGTTLLITDLRDNWNRDKIIKLGDALAKLIRPNIFDEENIEEDFKISIHALEQGIDLEIKNRIFEILKLKTTKISISIDSEGKIISTELRDGDTLIYKIKEINQYSKLKNISANIFYLNKSAKLTFSLRMGLNTRQYGSIFLYKNNVRIFPFGEPNEDTLQLDKRKSQKPSIYIGNKDLIGVIDIKGENESFIETSSRGDGFIKNETYNQFLGFVPVKIIERLEKYVIDVQKWGGGEYLSIEDEDLKDEDKFILKERALNLISNLSNTKDLLEVNYNDDLFEIISQKESNSALSIVKNLFRIAKETGNNDLLDAAIKTEERVTELRNALLETQRLFQEQRQQSLLNQVEIDNVVSENLFLKSIKSQDLDEVVSFLHHIGISSTTVESYLKGLYYRIQNNIDIPKNELRDIIQKISFENRKIISIAEFASKANFKMYTAETTLDIIKYIREYINNILGGIPSQEPKINLYKGNIESFVTKIKPIELNIIIDNLISNSKKAGAKNIDIRYYSPNEEELEINFYDDGKGIDSKLLTKIFEFGFTTTEGSGLGLFHVKKILDSLGGSITINSNFVKGVSFIITIKRK